ncbi:MAG: hypothetical protein IPM61_06135 [Chlorobi bacterium]|nr:MAG: hypothetical protein UZ07_CHB004002359 [Chlorobi bacterium OLB7]MBK8910890.1 hypothetical protein [Chlorobiota bacterium]
MDTPLGLDDPASGYTKQGHALHNEQVCDYLAKHGGFSDWVVTTAFYSAIHWIEDYLFPCVVKDGEKEIEVHSLESYTDFYNTSYGLKKSNHAIRGMLVRDRCAAILSNYSSLYDNCMTARYADYRKDMKTATKARRCLAAIKEFCLQQATKG